MAIKKQPKLRKELFVHILNKWLNDEREILAKWGIGNRKKALENLNKEYQGYLDLWERLEE